jgi:hypothetical protein
VPRFVATLFCLCAALACRPYETRVAVWAPGLDSLPSPLAHLPVIFLPYDRDSVLRALERGAPPRPGGRELDSLLALTRAPLAAYARLLWRTDSARRAVAGLRAELDTIPRNADGYRTRYAAFAALSDSIPAWEHRSAALQASLGSTDRRTAGALERLRERIATWEDSTYRGYAAAAASLEAQRHQRAIPDTTDATGQLAVALPRGRWWLYARAPDVNDPNGEWYWNVEVRGTSVRLDRSNALHRLHP